MFERSRATYLFNVSKYVINGTCYGQDQVALKWGPEDGVVGHTQDVPPRYPMQ